MNKWEIDGDQPCTNFQLLMAGRKSELFEKLHWLDVDSIELVQERSWNAVFQAVGRESLWAIKVFNNRRRAVTPLYDVSISLRLTRRLQDAKVPYVTCPINWPNGQLYGVLRDQTPIAIFPWVKGGSAGARDLDRCAEWLGTLHQLSMPIVEYDSIFQGRCNIPAWGIGDWLQNGTRRMSFLREMLREALDENSRPNSLIEDLERLDREFVMSGLVLSRAGRSLLHGDFRHTNVLVDSGAISGVIDFDLACVGPPAVDIAYGALFFGWDLNSPAMKGESEVAGFIEKCLMHSKESPEMISSALKWVAVRNAMLSFKPEQLVSRLAGAKQVILNADRWSEWFGK